MTVIDVLNILNRKSTEFQIAGEKEKSDLMESVIMEVVMTCLENAYPKEYREITKKDIPNNSINLKLVKNGKPASDCQFMRGKIIRRCKDDV